MRADLEGAASPGGRVARSLALGTLLGIALITWVQFAFDGAWVIKLVTANDLSMPARMTLIKSMALGGGVGLVAVVAALALAARRRVPVERVERVLWFLAPLLLLPTLPLFFRFRAWKDRHMALLPSVLFTAMVLEVLARRWLESIPGWLQRAHRLVRERLPGWVRRHAPSAAVVAGTVGYASFFSFYTLRWHWKIRTHCYDLAINENLLYRALHGFHMETTVAFPNDPGEYVAAHAKFGQYLFLPVYALFPRAETLLVIHSVLIAAGAIPLYAFARRRLPDTSAALLALAYLCFYPMHSANFYEVQYPPMAAVFVLGTVWALDARRWVALFFLFVCAAIMREDIPIGLAVIGAFALLSGHRPVAGAIIAVVATAWFLFLRFYVMERAGKWWFPDMYKGLWAPGQKGLVSVLKTLVTNPFFVLDKILTKEKVEYLLHLLTPLVFLPARRWYLWAAFLPGTVITLLVTDYKPITMFTFQYVMHWAPYTFSATALALAALWREAGAAKARAALAALCFSSVVLTYNYGAFPARDGTLRGGFFLVDFGFSPEERERLRNLREIIKVIPPDASVAATENSGAHVASRLEIYALRTGVHGAEYILASSKELGLEKTRPHLKRAVESAEFGIVARLGDFAVLKRSADPGQNRALIEDWKL